jgi:hypothetical protein
MKNWAKELKGFMMIDQKTVKSQVRNVRFNKKSVGSSKRSGQSLNKDVGSLGRNDKVTGKSVGSSGRNDRFGNMSVLFPLFMQVIFSQNSTISYIITH